MPSDSSEVQSMISHPAFVGTVLQAHSPRPTFFELLMTVASHMPSRMAVPRCPAAGWISRLDLGTIERSGSRSAESPWSDSEVHNKTRDSIPGLTFTVETLLAMLHEQPMLLPQLKQR